MLSFTIVQMSRPADQKMIVTEMIVILTDPKRRGHAMPWGWGAHMKTEGAGSSWARDSVTSRAGGRGWGAKGRPEGGGGAGAGASVTAGAGGWG